MDQNEVGYSNSWRCNFQVNVKKGNSWGTSDLTIQLTLSEQLKFERAAREIAFVFRLTRLQSQP